MPSTFIADGSATQINVSATSLDFVAPLADYAGLLAVAYESSSSDYVQAINSTTGLPTGVEITLTPPTPPTGFTNEGLAIEAALAGNGGYIAFSLAYDSATSQYYLALDHYSATGQLVATPLSETIAASAYNVYSLPQVIADPDGGYDVFTTTFSTTGSTTTVSAEELPFSSSDGEGTPVVLASQSYNSTTEQVGGQTVTEQAAGARAFEFFSRNGSQDVVATETAFFDDPTTFGSLIVYTPVSETLSLTVPGVASPIQYNLLTSPSQLTVYAFAGGGFESNGTVVYAVEAETFTANATTNTVSETESTSVYDVVGGAPQLVFSTPTQSIANQVSNGPGVPVATVKFGMLSNNDFELASQGDILGQTIFSVYSPQGQFIGQSNSFIGATPGGQLESYYTSGGNAYMRQVVAAPQSVADNFSGIGASDLLLENTSGAVVIGSLNASTSAGATENYTEVSALGSGWSFEGNGDFLGDGGADFLLENTSGQVYVGEVASGATTYTQVGALGPEWTFEGTGDYLGNGQDQFLIENTNGVVDVGNVVGGVAEYEQVTALGSAWKFVGSGDFLGDGHYDFLIENNSGTVDVGEVSGGVTTYTQVGALGSEWKFVGAGDFLANGQDQFLMENTNGAVVVGNVVSDAAQYTQVGALGSQWSFLGTGDYLGTGAAGFMIENTSGAVVLGTIGASGQASYAQVGALGPEWASHS